MSSIAGLKKLCSPALFYLVISISAILVMYLQNFSSEKVYCLGSYSCNVPSVFLIFVVKLLYILFWTWILNLICRDGHSMIAWVLVLFPILLFFVLIGLMMIR